MRHYLLLFLMCFFWTTEAEAQQSQIEFGKNRVQYHKRFDDWMKYESLNFITTWYGTGRKIAETASLIAEADLPYIQEFLEYTPPEKIRIIIYTDLSDLKQTNIGNEEQFTNTAGQTLIRENKIFVYFNGDHQHLRKQIREGLVKVFIQNMIIGDNWQEMVQNAALLNLPDWYIEGLASFISEDWTPKMSLWLQEQLAQESKNDFFAIAQKYPKKGGQAMFYYLNAVYGQANLSNLIYLTRLNRSLENGIIHVYGNSMADVADEWRIFFEQQFEKENKNRQPLDPTKKIKIKNKHNARISKIEYSPDGSQLLYVQNEIGKVKIFIQDTKTNKRKRIFKKGFRNPFQATDYNYPCVAWRADGQSIAIVYKYRDVIYLSMYDVKTKKTTTDEFAPGFQNVHNIDFVDGHTLAISASVNGFTDIFLYYPSKRQASRVTSDIWDDLDVKFTTIRGNKGLLFSSNRPDSLLIANKLDTLLPIGDFDIFYYNLDSMGKELVQLTNTPFANEKSPIAIDTTWFGYLSDQYGIYNREVGYLEDKIVGYHQNYRMKDGAHIIVPSDSIIPGLDTAFIDSSWVETIWRPQPFVHPTTNYNYYIVDQSFSNGQLAYLVLKDNEYLVWKDSLDVTQNALGALSQHQLNRINAQKKHETTPYKGILTKQPKDTIPPKATYYFVTQFDDIPESVQHPEAATAHKRKANSDNSLFSNPGPLNPFQQSRITPKRIRFRMNYLTTQADNNLLFGGLDSYAGTPEEFTTPPPGILMKANFKDLFEDYEIEGGLRFNLTFNQMEYFMQYWDRKHRIDRQYGIYLRKTSKTDAGFNFFVPHNAKNQTVIATSQWRYPFDIYRSLRATTTMRFDKYLESSTDTFSLRSPIIKEKRVGLKLAYVFDNTIDVYTNIKNGTRYKIYAEIVKKYNIDFVDKFDFSLNKGFMGVLGVDARHYQRLLKHSIIASRISAATSFGSEKLLYVMGGTENWLIPQYDRSTPIPTENYAYRTLAASMRGFRQNIRNGNSFILLNNEVRLPIFRYLSRRPLKSTFFNNIQLVGFVDAGIAWTGKDPLDLDNPLNTRTVTATDNTNTPIVHVKIKYFRDPTVLGYGVGLRTMLFGYFVRLDYGWGVETRVVQKPKLYLSMGTDF